MLRLGLLIIISNVLNKQYLRVVAQHDMVWCNGLADYLARALAGGLGRLRWMSQY
jgi:hypothetical protein